MKKNYIAFPSGMEWRDNTEQTKYEIVIPLQKETLRRRLKETTYPLCIENEAYRHQILSDFSNDCIRLKASAGIMKSVWHADHWHIPYSSKDKNFDIALSYSNGCSYFFYSRKQFSYDIFLTSRSGTMLLSV